MYRMRISAMGTHVIFVQTSTRPNEWTQKQFRHDCFETYMETEFPEYWAEYLKAETDQSAAEFFYHYGETPEMIRKGIAYVFEQKGE